MGQQKSFSLSDLKDSLLWEKIFANDETNKGLISKIYKQVIKLNIKKKQKQKKTQTIQLKNGQKT